MAKRKAQLEFNGKGMNKPPDCFGGHLLKGNNAKTKRPLESKLPIHLVLRASKSVLRVPVKYERVMKIVRETARKHGVNIYKLANVGNHMHLAIKLARTHRWSSFIRELTGRLALLMRDLTKGSKLWLHRPFTRIVRSWKKAFKDLKAYVELNQWQSEGRITRTESTYKKELEKIFGTG